MTTSKKIDLRQQANKLLSKIVSIACNNYSDLRYIQILWMFGIIDSSVNRIGLPTVTDRFSEEPIDTLIRCYQTIHKVLENLNAYQLIEEINKLIYNE